jgi:hypothetical protein
MNFQYELIKLYLAAFLRPPEKSGLEYWLYQLENGKSLDSVLDTVFSLDVVTAIYPTKLSSSDFVTQIYQNVFGRSPDLEGLNYWTTQMIQGRSRGNLVLDMINAGLSTPSGSPGKDFIVNRMNVAQFAVDQQLKQVADLTPAYLKSVMANVNANPTSVIAANYAYSPGVTGIGIGPPIDPMVVVAALDGLSASEISAGVVVSVSLRGTNAKAGYTIELLLNQLPFSNFINKIISEDDVKAQKLSMTIPNTVNWGSDGVKTLTAFVRDPNGNSGLAGGSVQLEVNMQAPNAPIYPLIIATALDGINTAEKTAGILIKVDLTATNALVGDKLDILLNFQTVLNASPVLITSNDVNSGFVSVLIPSSAAWGADGSKTLTARITDKSGNVGLAGGEITLLFDTLAPAAITKSLLIYGIDGVLNSSKIATDINVVVDLGETTPKLGDSVELLINGRPFKNSTLHLLTQDELFSLAANLTIKGGDPAWGIVDGARTITARLVDSAGNQGGAGGDLKLTIDVTLPVSQNAQLSMPAAQNGVSAAELSTGVSVIVSLIGTAAAAGDVIQLQNGGKAFPQAISLTITAEHITAKSATIAIPASTDWGGDGIKSLTAVVVDKAGNLGAPSAALNVNIDTTAPGVVSAAIQSLAATGGISAAERLQGVDLTLSLAGTNALVGDKLEILLNGNPFNVPVLKILSDTDIQNGSLNVSVPIAAGWGADGSKLLSMRLTDVAGNVGIAGGDFTTNLDTIMLAMPSKSYNDVNNSGTVDAGDTYVFTFLDPSNKALTLANITAFSGHVFGASNTPGSATWSADGLQLTVSLGAGATIVAGDIITLVGVADLAGNASNFTFTL